MKRRTFIALVGEAVVGWPLAARAQPPDRVRQIGVLMGTSESDRNQKAMVSTFTQALEELGWIEGMNIRIERRWAAGDIARLRTQAAELARLARDALFVQGTPGMAALRKAAPTTPLVFVMITDPVSSGLVSSLAFAGGNITGFTTTTNSRWAENGWRSSRRLQRRQTRHSINGSRPL